MRILHSAVMFSYSSGIYKQMRDEQDAALKIGCNLTVKIFSPIGVYPAHNIVHFASFSKNNIKLFNLYNWVLFKREYYEWLLSVQNSYDVFIIRYSVHDPYLYEFMQEVKLPVYFIHHTLELPELYSMGFVGKFRYIFDKYMGARSLPLAKGLIAVTDEIFDFECSRLGSDVLMNKGFIYPNGVMLNDSNLLLDKRTDIPELIFVASYFFEWHGLDLLLDNLKNNSENFILHIVGVVNDNDKKIACNDRRVIFHGEKNNSEIEEISQSCWLGLTSFALNRKGMEQACTLKVREYLSLGLPVYSGHLDVFPQDFLFYKKGSPSFSDIITFAKEVRNVSKIDVVQQSKPYINKEDLVYKLVNYIEKSNGCN